MQDLQGLPLGTRSQAAADSFNRTLRSYIGNRSDLSDRLGDTLAADPEFALAHCAKGYFTMLMYKSAALPMAREAQQRADSLLRGAFEREKKHVTALAAWTGGDLDHALAIWEDILSDHPTDVLALRLSHFNYFWLGRREEMRRSVERAAAGWDDGRELYGNMLSCLAFGQEECGDYAAAERTGRRAVELDPADGWGAHAVAHVLEMQGRHEEGVQWLSGLERHWGPLNNFVHHLWWHRAMFHLERREFDAVLEHYDRRFRDLSSPLVQKMPDLYIDIQNAASILFRLERQKIDTGNRWIEIADKAEARIGDCLSVFTLPHWMMALAATGRDSAASRMLQAMEEHGSSATTTAPLVRDIALPVCKAVLAHRKGDYSATLELMTPLLDELQHLGGSHAQRDVLWQLYLDAALKAERPEEVRTVLGRAAACFPIPPAKRIGYAEAERRFSG